MLLLWSPLFNCKFFIMESNKTTYLFIYLLSPGSVNPCLGLGRSTFRSEDSRVEGHPPGSRGCGKGGSSVSSPTPKIPQVHRWTGFTLVIKEDDPRVRTDVTITRRWVRRTIIMSIIRCLIRWSRRGLDTSIPFRDSE